ncbi:MAG: hypothetical protein H6707_21620 [Deltaproteobacteria bacterium]|nr:hypothetical protein [Deltaproteobacteria bacterium]
MNTQRFLLTLALTAFPFAAFAGGPKGQVAPTPVANFGAVQAKSPGQITYSAKLFQGWTGATIQARYGKSNRTINRNLRQTAGITGKSPMAKFDITKYAKKQGLYDAIFAVFPNVKATAGGPEAVRLVGMKNGKFVKLDRDMAWNLGLNSIGELGQLANQNLRRLDGTFSGTEKQGVVFVKRNKAGVAQGAYLKMTSETSGQTILVPFTNGYKGAVIDGHGNLQRLLSTK